MLKAFKNKIKSKFTKKSETRGGITFSDKQLFDVGSEFKYVITDNKVLIVKKDQFEEMSKELGIENVTSYEGVVSKKGANQIPLVDIRRKEALATFGKADTLVVDIYDEVVVVSGYTNIQEDLQNNSLSAKGKTSSSTKITKNKVVNFTAAKLQKTFEIALSKKQLKASGEQISFDFDSFNFESNQNGNVFAGIKNAFNELEIPLKAASFFAGAGLFDEGFKQAGFDIAFAIEKNEAAARTYTYNHGGYVMCADVRDYSLFEKFLKGISVFFGGPPCQGFSNANQITKFLNNPNNMLAKTYIDIIKRSKDLKVFVLENVPQILTAGDGKFKDEILSELSDFEISYGVLTSADYGSPQLRKRAIIIGSKIGKIELPEAILQPDEYVTVGEALMDIDDHAPNQQDYSKPRADTVERMKHVPQGGNWQSIPVELRTNKMSQGTHSSVYKRLDENKPSITITNPRKSNIIHPRFNRILSVRECARLFGLRDSFTFLGTLDEKQQQIANAVPVNLGAAIGHAVKNAIQKFNIRLGFEKPVLV